MIFKTKEMALKYLDLVGYSRISRSIDAMWGTPELDSYFSSIMISDREGRDGFPPDVFEAILSLYGIHTKDIPVEPYVDITK